MENIFKKVADKTWQTVAISGDFSLFVSSTVLYNISSHMKDTVQIDYKTENQAWPNYPIHQVTLTFASNEAEAEFLMLYSAGRFDE